MGFSDVISNVHSNTSRWSRLGFVGMNFHLCEQKWMFKNVPSKFQLQILRFDVKLSIYLCSETDGSGAVLKSGIRKETVGRKMELCSLWSI